MDERSAGNAAPPRRAASPWHVAFAALASLAIAVTLVGLDRTGWLWEAPDELTYDWRTYLLTERATHPRDDIALVLIDEESLVGYGYVSPIDRRLTADVVGAIADAGAKAIGLDFIIDRPTEPAKDAAFVAALRAARARLPVVLGAIDDRSGVPDAALAFQADIVARAGVTPAQIYVASEQQRLAIGDQAVRYIVSAPGPQQRPFFAQALAAAVGVRVTPASPLIAWQHPPAAAGANFVPTFTVPAHRDAAGTPTGDILPSSWRAALAGKIVLVGGAFRDRDRHLTPLSVATAERVPGVQIHAQILAQLLDARSVHQPELWQEILIVAGVAALGFLVAYRWQLTGDELRVSVIAFLLFVGLSFGLFAAFRFILPTATLFFAWPIALYAGRRALAIAWPSARSPAQPAKDA